MSGRPPRKRVTQDQHAKNKAAQKAAEKKAGIEAADRAEKHFELQNKIDNVQIFYGIDIVESIVNFSSESINEISFGDNPKTPYTIKSSGDYLSLGLSPLLGVKYFITPRLSLSTELHCTVSYFDSYSKNAP